jgi:hypothetical protein
METEEASLERKRRLAIVARSSSMAARSVFWLGLLGSMLVLSSLSNIVV